MQKLTTYDQLSNAKEGTIIRFTPRDTTNTYYKHPGGKWLNTSQYMHFDMFTNEEILNHANTPIVMEKATQNTNPAQLTNTPEATLIHTLTEEGERDQQLTYNHNNTWTDPIPTLSPGVETSTPPYVTHNTYTTEEILNNLGTKFEAYYPAPNPEPQTPPEVVFKDSEVMYIAAYHMEEAAKLAFNLDYGEEMQRHVEKIVQLGDWFEWVLEHRINPQLENN